MKRIYFEDLKEGHVLAAPISDIAGVELLRIGTELTLKHIAQIRNAGIEWVYIESEKKNQIVEQDLSNIYHEIDKLESQLFKPADRNAANHRMEVHVLTGEGNIPIDVKHEAAIQDTKEVFEGLKSGDQTLDMERIKNNLIETLPDVVRNNDVLMRLAQLRKTDDYTFEHSMRVSILATMIGKWLGYSQDELLNLGQAGMLFDIGKMLVPEELLKREGPLTSTEFEAVKRHTQLGYNILLRTKGVDASIKYAALHHHERLDGSGYPLRLGERQIHYFAKIIAVCDVFDAITNDRSYRKKISHVLALDYLRWSSGKLFDPEVVYILSKGISEFLIGKKCRLSTGQIGKIIFIEENYPTRPTVQVGDKFFNLRNERKITIEEVFN